MNCQVPKRSCRSGIRTQDNTIASPTLYPTRPPQGPAVGPITPIACNFVYACLYDNLSNAVEWMPTNAPSCRASSTCRPHWAGAGCHPNVSSWSHDAHREERHSGRDDAHHLRADDVFHHLRGDLHLSTKEGDSCLLRSGLPSWRWDNVRIILHPRDYGLL